eukprot:12754495-Alexandrium_andersonii.AAC.1
MSGVPGAPLPRAATLAVWLDVLLQGVAGGRWELRQVKDELLASLLALAVIDANDAAALAPLGRAG